MVLISLGRYDTRSLSSTGPPAGSKINNSRYKREGGTSGRTAGTDCGWYYKGITGGCTVPVQGKDEGGGRTAGTNAAGARKGPMGRTAGALAAGTNKLHNKPAAGGAEYRPVQLQSTHGPLAAI